MAVERWKSCDNIVALAQELGVHRRTLYKWRDQLEPVEDGEGEPANLRERELRRQVTQLKRLVADKTLEGGFFQGALQKVEARRQSRATLAGRHLRTDSRSDAAARQAEYRADVSPDWGQSSWFLSLPATTGAGGRGHGSAVSDSADRGRAPAALWLAKNYRRTATAWDASEP